MCDNIQGLLDFAASNVKNSLDEIINEKNLNNTSIEILRGSNKGDNYLGQIYRIIITEQQDDKNKNKSIHLILKKSISNKVIREYFPIRKLYEREIYVYIDILPLFKNFQASLNTPNVFTNYPIFLKSCLNDDDEYLIMEDQKHLGFLMADRKKTFDFNHCSLVLQNLARYHAISFALKKSQPETFENLKNECRNIFVTCGHMESLQRQYETMAENASKSLDPVEDSNVLEVFSKFQKRLFQDMLDFSKQNTFGQYAVILHGDCWGNNILFSYKNAADPSKPTDVTFLDWQLCYYASPAIDLSYFFCNCTNSELLEKHYDELINIYHNSLTKSLKEMGCDDEELFPHNALENEMKKYFRHGLYMACSNLFYFIGDSEDLPDMEELSEEAMNQPDSNEYAPKNMDQYYERVRGIIKHAVSRGFI